MTRPDMINLIKNDQELSGFIVDECTENDICVDMDNVIDKNDYVIIKVDDYYNSLNIPNRPPSPDCLIVQKCKNGDYALIIVELKNIKNSKGFTVDNMCAKFDTCLTDFIPLRFSKYFDLDYKSICLLFVSKIEIYRRDHGLYMDALINKRFSFRGKNLKIKPRMPIPKLKPCY